MANTAKVRNSSIWAGDKRAVAFVGSGDKRAGQTRTRVRVCRGAFVAARLSRGAFVPGRVDVLVLPELYEL